MYVRLGEETKCLRNFHTEQVAKQYFYNLKFDFYEVMEKRGAYEITGSMTTDGYSHKFKIIVDKEGYILDYDCDCKRAFHNLEGCAHIGAALLKFKELTLADIPYTYKSPYYGLNNYQRVLAWQEEQEKRMLNRRFMRTKSILEESFDDFNQDNEETLEHSLSLNCYVIRELGQLSLEYKIGKEKSYVIKDLEKFVNQYNGSEKVVFGKFLNVVLESQSFTKDGLTQVEFIMRNDPYGRYVLIDDRNIDDFYNTYHNLTEYIDMDFGYGDEQYFSIDIIKHKDFYEISLKDDQDIIFGTRYAYRLTGRTLMRLSSKFNSSCKKLVEALREEEIYVSKADMKDVGVYLLQRAKEFIKITGYNIDDVMPVDLHTKTYIDLNSEGDLLLKLETSVPEDTTLEQLREDHRLPLDYRKTDQLVHEYMKYNEEEDTYILKDKKDEVYNFIMAQIPVLQRYGNVYISDAIKNIKKPKKVNVQVGVRYENNLLQMSISSDDINQDELAKVLQAYHRRKKFYKLKNGELIDLNSESLSELDELSTDLHLSSKDISKGELSLDTSKAFYLNTQDFEDMEIERDETFKDWLLRIPNIKKSQYTLPEQYENILRDYQKDGFQWLRMMNEYGFGGILADDMGLGKTLQVIALLESVRNDERTSIVITPATLLYNWYDEIQKFHSTLKVECISGSADLRREAIAHLEDYDVVITSYDYMRRDEQLYNGHKFYYIILDEAQYIKNQTTKNAKSVKGLVGEHRLALTGTPIENSLAELWSIYDFLMPNYLFNYHYFKAAFEKPIVKDQDEEVQKRLQNLVQPFILRRTKKQVLEELPDKIEKDLKIDFSDEERNLYLANVMNANKEMNAGDVDKIQILALLTHLRQICLDPRLLYDNIKTPSSKILSCLDLIESSIENDKKILIFSSFTTGLQLIEREIKKRKISYYMLTGETSKAKRREMVHNFESDDTKVFLISLKAGGTGLNLVAASVVIHLDPWWNISAQNQATDRAYRIGQDKNVEVYKLIMKDSVEERIQALQKQKKDLADTFVEGNELNLAAMSSEDIMSLFKVDNNE